MTTGMSAPPIGTTTRMPMMSAMTAMAISAHSRVGSAMISAAMTTAPMANTALTTCRSGINTGCVATMPWSLPNAMRLPVRVSEPINTDSATVTLTTGSTSPVSFWLRICAPATRADAAPPKPLKIATICGIAVNWTRRAAITPIKAPTIKPTIIHS